LEFAELNRISEARVNSSLSDLVEESQELLIEAIGENNERLFSEEDGIDKDLFVLKEVPITEPEQFLIGGSLLTSAAASWSLGACGTLSTQFNQNGFVTSGHGLRLNQQVFRNGVHIGNVTRLNYNTGEATPSDWAFVETNNRATLSNQVFSHQAALRSVTSQFANVPPVGTLLHRYGSTTGHGTVRVTNTNALIVNNVPGGIYEFRGVEASVVTTPSRNGDSGGPYFELNSSNQARFAGVHHGSLLLPNGTTLVYFTPLTAFRQFSVRTTPW
jgi:hypothetical protein